MQYGSDYLAPAHPYLPKLGNGIEFFPEKVVLWENGQPTLDAAHQQPNAYEFWRTFAFLDAFPQVTHWYFRSAWTQRVRFSPAQTAFDEQSIWGYVQFIDEQTPSQIWTVSTTPGNLPEVFVSSPPNETHPANLPLRLTLASLTLGMLEDRIPINQWITVTSLVNAADVRTVFQTSLPYRLADAPPLPLTEILCQTLGLRKPVHA